MFKQVFMMLVCFTGITVYAQQKPTEPDKSPLDVSYSPPNYPILKMNGKAPATPNARVIYSRPQKAGRPLFGGIISYNQVWRLGANEATEIEFFKNAKINGKHISKGRYTLFAICGEDKWTIILNDEKDVWGLAYNPKKDVLRTEVPVQYTEGITEYFTMYFEDVKGGTTLHVMWDNIHVTIPVSF